VHFPNELDWEDLIITIKEWDLSGGATEYFAATFRNTGLIGDWMCVMLHEMYSPAIEALYRSKDGKSWELYDPHVMRSGPGIKGADKTIEVLRELS
jgi:hypothetical protein